MPNISLEDFQETKRRELRKWAMDYTVARITNKGIISTEMSAEEWEADFEGWQETRKQAGLEAGK